MGDRYDESGELTKPAHKSDHAFVNDLKEKAKRRQSMVDKVMGSLIGGFIWAIGAGIVSIIIFAFNQKVGK